jgi:hypothetical protein
MGRHRGHVCSRVGGRSRHRAFRCYGVAVGAWRRVRTVPDLQQRALALRTAPQGDRSWLPSQVRRPHARPEDAAVTGALGRSRPDLGDFPAAHVGNAPRGGRKERGDRPGADPCPDHAMVNANGCGHGACTLAQAATNHPLWRRATARRSLARGWRTSPRTQDARTSRTETVTDISGPTRPPPRRRGPTHRRWWVGPLAMIERLSGGGGRLASPP